MWTSQRLRSGLRRTALGLLIIVACCWVCLYLDSVCQRRKAEHLISDLKSFPFATAGFAEVRELAERYDGAPIQQFPLLNFPQFGYPLEDSQGRLHMPLLENGGPTCTVRDCTFEIWIRPWHLRAFPRDRVEMLLTSTLEYSGIRPWGVYARFKVKNGKLSESHTEFGRLGPATVGRLTGLVPLAYEVVSATHSIVWRPGARLFRCRSERYGWSGRGIVCMVRTNLERADATCFRCGPPLRYRDLAPLQRVQ